MKILSIKPLPKENPRHWPKYEVHFKYAWYERLIGNRVGSVIVQETDLRSYWNPDEIRFMYGNGDHIDYWHPVSVAVNKFIRWRRLNPE